MNKHKLRFVPALALVGVVAVVSAGCSLAQEAATAAVVGCNEFPSHIDTLNLSGDAQAFVQAGADLVQIAGTLEGDVTAACAGIATDLGVTDTWTAMGPSGGGTADDEVQEACRQAQDAINAVLNGGGSAQVSCGLSATGGQCTVDANVEASCEASCSGMATCTPPSVTVSCDPGDLSVVCGASCDVNATCEGSVQVAAQCNGSCEADCSGKCFPGKAPSVHCEGTCMGTCEGTCTVGGTATQVSGACAGSCSGSCDAECDYDPGTPAHCEGTCQGTCNGDCTLDANASVMCGANVRCKGGCSVTGTAPQCEGQVMPAKCSGSVNCQAACQSHADIQASCTPPTVTMECSASADPQVQKLVTTLGAHMPAILNAAQTQGPLATQAIQTLGSTGGAVVADLGNIGGKALACATTALSASADASVSVSVSVRVSANVSASASGS